MKFDKPFFLKASVAIAVIGSAAFSTISLKKPYVDYQAQLVDAAKKQAQQLGSRLNGKLSVVSEAKAWRPVYAVNVAEFCRATPAETLAKAFGAGFTDRPLTTLTGDFSVRDAKSIIQPFIGVALFLESQDKQELNDSRPFGVWWFLQMSEDKASALRQHAVNGKLSGKSLHFDAETPLVPVTWTTDGGFTLFAAVTPRNVQTPDWEQMLDSEQATDPSSYAGPSTQRYEAASEAWTKLEVAKEWEWEAQAQALRAKLNAAKGTPQAEAVATEVSDLATKAKAEKESWLKAHPKPTPQNSAL